VSALTHDAPGLWGPPEDFEAPDPEPRPEHIDPLELMRMAKACQYGREPFYSRARARAMHPARLPA
jgi:hypothetical protein